MEAMPRGSVLLTHLPTKPTTSEVAAATIRMTAGNFRLLSRLLAQIERILDVNDIQKITVEVVLEVKHTGIVCPRSE
jgi:hypothetical protein